MKASVTIEQESANRDLSDSQPVIVNKIVLEHGHACSVRNCLTALTLQWEELSECDRDHVACKAQRSYSLALYRSFSKENREMNIRGATGSLCHSKGPGKRVSHLLPWKCSVRSLFF